MFSALVAGYEAIGRLLYPHAITSLGWVAVAGVIGFLGNEAVAVFRIRIGREINSAALIADGYHARTDGLTSLAVVVGAAGVWLGFPLADPIIGLVITLAIFGIVWQSARAVFTRMLDGVEPKVIDEIHHAAAHVAGIERVADAKARWLGHELFAEVAIVVDDSLPLAQANEIAGAFEAELFEHLAGLKSVNVRFAAAATKRTAPYQGHHHAPEPFYVADDLADGTLEIIDTDPGERMRLTTRRMVDGLQAVVTIARPEGPETLVLHGAAGDTGVFVSGSAPAEPHEFDAVLTLSAGAKTSTLPFHMAEPAHHH